MYTDRQIHILSVLKAGGKLISHPTFWVLWHADGVRRQKPDGRSLRGLIQRGVLVHHERGEYRIK